MAGQIAELAQQTLRGEFRNSNPGAARVLLVEMADRVLTAFPPSLYDHRGGAHPSHRRAVRRAGNRLAELS
jgi:NADH dehydrogenase